MKRKITCLNENNLMLTFDDTFSPWLLENCEGIYVVKNNVSTSENTMTDGSTYQSSTASMRNIVLTLRDHPESDHKENRQLLYSLFKAKSEGVFTYYEGDTVRQIVYHVEDVDIDSVPRSRRATVSLLCPDPFFTDLEDVSVKMAGWVSDFQWQHEFTAAGEEFGHRTAEYIKTIENESAADHIGLTITLEASGAVLNPAVTLVEQNESIQVGTSGKPLQMIAGDKVIITTHINNKHAYLMRAGVKTDINEYLSEDSEFLQIMNGNNTFGYSADGGENYLSVTISFRYRYPGV